MLPRLIPGKAWATLAVLLVIADPFAPASAQSAQSGAAQAPSLSATRQNLAKRVGAEGFAALLESSALALAPRDALAVLAEFIPKAPEASRSSLYSLQASLGLIAGEYLQAAAALQKAYPGSPEQLMRASRCYLAGGDIAQAEKILASIAASQGGTRYADAISLGRAWVALLSGEPERARYLLETLASAKGQAPERREALFLLWMLSISPDASRTYLAALKADFPSSMEYAATQSRLSLKPAAWLLNALHSNSATDSDRAIWEKRPDSATEATNAKTPAELQVGWFSREENARALRSALVAKGFEAYVEEGASSQGEKRWAVIVKAKTDWIQTQAQLKDLGYESYLISQPD
ncbi:MAG TPA: tetratricopeptide repeat protein [Rectinemataceae bacterium]